MTQYTFVKLKFTRGLTAVCTCVLLSVSVFSFFIGFQNRFLGAAEVSGEKINQSEPIFIIDPGHGGEDGGTQSSSGILEKDINLDIGCYLNDIFRFFGYETVMTRSEDIMIYDSGCKTQREKKVSDIKNRMALINGTPSAVFLSIHQNHYEGSSSKGTQVFYSGNAPESKMLAEAIQKTVVSDIQPDNQRQIKKSGKEIYLLYHAQVPAVMVECGFLSNSEESQKLCNEDYQKSMAFEIFKGSVSAF